MGMDRATVGEAPQAQGRQRPDRLSDHAQAEGLLEAAKADQNRQIYPFILIGLRTGMRKSEILAIRREHVDLDVRSIYIPQSIFHKPRPARARSRSQNI